MKRLLLPFAVGIATFCFTASRSDHPSTDHRYSSNSAASLYDSVRASLTGYHWPTEEFLRITSSFADFRRTHFHGGIDISTLQKKGYRVFASKAGFVSHISVSPHGYGKLLLVQHPDGYTTAYAHLQRFNDTLDAYVKALQSRRRKYPLGVNLTPEQFPVAQGDVIAYTGDTGIGSAHLHFEIHDEQFNPVNPLLVPEFSNYIKDSTRPEIHKIAFTPLEHSSFVNGGQRPLILNATKISSRAYRFKNPVQATGLIGVELYAMDHSDDTWYRSTATDLEMYVDTTLVFTSKITRVQLSETKQIARHFNWGTLEKRKGYFQKLYVERGNTQPFYTAGQAELRGLATEGFTEGYHELRIVASDVFGNHAEISGTVLFNHPPRIELRTEDHRATLHVRPTSSLKSVNIFTLSGKGWVTRVIPVSTLVPLPISDIVFLKSFSLLEAGTIAVLKRLGSRSEAFFLEVALAADELGFTLPIEIRKNSIVKAVAENIYGTKSYPEFVIPASSGQGDPSFRFSKELVRDFMPVTVTTRTLLPMPPLLFASSSNGSRLIPLHQVELYKYVGSHRLAPDDKGTIRITAQLDSTDTQLKLLDEFTLYPVTPENGGTVESGNGEFRITFGQNGVYEPSYFQMKKTADGYSVTPTSTMLSKGGIAEYRLARSYPGKVGLFYNKSIIDWTNPGGKRVLSGKVDQMMGDFTLIEDNIPPEITHLRVLYSPRKFIVSFGIRDHGAGVEADSIRIMVDDEVLVGEFDPYRRFVFYQEYHPLARGTHTVTVEGSDRMANKAVARRTFTVSR